ncbi:MAG TPA: hypothetical protein VLC46_26030 [Thermoanaerobaculia bacterium]|jgi:hypothetical protein|nr:hypothetical protein [Thermoanaerobaculia bacterium]
MLLVLLQITLAAAAGFGLWRLWRSLAGRGAVSLIVGAGFLIRALTGQILFWISWLHLPIARPLQLGNGFWFFAVDGPGYLSYADELIGRGVKATLFLTAAYPSRVYLQVFTAATAAFGVVASVAILFNCAAYLVTCAIITRLGSRESNAELPRFVALAAVAFGPGMILWSLQPLKDTFFSLLVTALVAVCFLWQELWRNAVASKWLKLLACAAAMLVLTYAIGGVRWYFAAFVWACCGVFFILVSMTARHKAVALLASALLFVLLAQAVRLGGAEDIHPGLRRILDPRPSIAAQFEPSYVKHYVAETRIAFEQTGGATKIAAGPALAPPSPAPKKAREETIPPPRLEPKAIPSGSATTTVSPTPTKAKVEAMPPPRLEPKAIPSGSAPVPVSPTPVKAKNEAIPPPHLEPKAIPPGPALEPVSPAPTDTKDDAMPARRLGPTLLAGFAAMFIPRFLAQAVGLIRIGGGRGFWLFVEVDTLVLDAVLLFAIVYCTRALRSRARVTPLFVLLVLLFLMTALPMMYTVSNFGTLFRLREMVYLIAAILPLTLALRPPAQAVSS